MIRLLTKWRSIGLPLDDGKKLEGYVTKVRSSLLCHEHHPCVDTRSKESKLSVEFPLTLLMGRACQMHEPWQWDFSKAGRVQI